MKGRGLIHRFGFAWSGIASAWREERSFRTQVGAATLAALALLGLRPGWGWAALVLICMGMVLAAELLNTGLERLADGLHPGPAAFVRTAKDCAAGGVLVLSMVAVLVFLAMLMDVFFAGKG